MNKSNTELLKVAVNTAEYFGFTPLAEFKKHPTCKSCTQPIPYSLSANDRKLDKLYGILGAGAQNYIDSKLHSLEAPVLFYTIDPVPRTQEIALNLQIFGVPKSIAEVVLIQTSRALLEELGYANNIVRINSLGDKDSGVRYYRELNNFLKKRLADMPTEAREKMKSHVCDALMYLVDKEHELAYKTPNPMEYLSDQSRKHFREIIEYMDMSETPYEIDPKLIGHHKCYSDAIFSIDILDKHDKALADPEVTVNGGRYDSFMQHHIKREIPASGAVVIIKGSKLPARIPKSSLSKKPQVYVVQLGYGPKIKTLQLVNQLRKSGIVVKQDLASDSLSTQLRDAEARSVQYALIMGQKEFVDGTVILRDMKARKQEHVALENIHQRLVRKSSIVAA
ncbi:hypothetical protein CL653_03895 [bacterium]|nr:hypothetical protein [bacterium]